LRVAAGAGAGREVDGDGYAHFKGTPASRSAVPFKLLIARIFCAQPLCW
jgi:hypothetical protein